ncbi:hypothetical protein TWF281_005868 [Arthrobotrys megalospora]
MVWRRFVVAALPALGHAFPTAEIGINRRESGPLDRREIGIGAMCSWELPSSAIIRDQIFINGGKLRRANITGAGAPLIEVNDIPTSSYYLNLGTGFNVTDVPFQTIDTLFPQVTNGFMAANDNSFWLYGGLLADTDSIQSYPAADNIQVYDVYRQGPDRIWKDGWQVGPVLSNGVNRYVAGGAGVNVRELNTTYYFSGARNKNWGEIRGDGTVRARYSANVTSSQFVSADLTDQIRTKWTNTSLSAPARPRVNAEMVYVPAGKLGALIVVGGVTNADWQGPNLDEDETSYEATVKRSIATGPSFLQTVDVYDINDKRWYLQNTTGDIPPTGLAQFCTTVASSEDGKSHHIYIYGGYPGQSETFPISFYDDVYVLSIPAFEWIKVLDGSPLTARKGHKCVKPLPDQMFIIGGAPSSATNCIDIVRILNLNKLEYLDEYDPSVYEEYKVPQAIRDVVGGDEKGSATKTASRWAAPTLEAMFLSEIPPQRAATFYPYPSEPPNSTPSVSIIRTKTETPKFVYPVVAVCIVVVLAIVGGCIAFFCIRRRKQRQAAKDAGNEQFQNQEKDTKGVTYPQYPADAQQGYGSYGSMSSIAPAYAAGDQYSGNPQIVFELPAEPKGPVELDSGASDYTKLGVIDENRANDAFSIVPTPATERSDPLSPASRNPSQRTRRSVFSEATSPIDNIPGGVSPLTPDPEIAGNPGETPITPAEFSWWRKQSLRGGAVARKLSNFSIKTLSRTNTNTGVNRSDTTAAIPPVAQPAAQISSSNITPPATVVPTTASAGITPPATATQEPTTTTTTTTSTDPVNHLTEEAVPTPPPAPTTTTTTTTTTTNTN